MPNDAPSATARIAALIVAAGVGARFGGGMPKQYRLLAGKALLRHNLDALLAHPAIATVQVVIHPDHRTFYDTAIHASAAMHPQKLLPPVIGGAHRGDSVRAGLDALAGTVPDCVLIHDAARPFLTHPIIDRVIAALDTKTAAVPAIAVIDTVRRHTAGQWREVPRDGLLRIQTPQAFPFAALRQLAESGAETHTDDAAAWLAAGHPLRYVQGDERLRKITTEADMAWAEAAATTRIAVGMGFDVHALMPSGERGLMRLGGIDIAHDHKAHGHSDADVLLHAITDALLGALALGDIGQHFSPQDEQWKGADSRQFLRFAFDKLRGMGGVIQHVDATVICEHPKIAPHRDALRQSIADLLELPLSHVSVKATTTERLGFTGRGEGIAAQAVATVALPVAA